MKFCIVSGGRRGLQVSALLSLPGQSASDRKGPGDVQEGFRLHGRDRRLYPVSRKVDDLRDCFKIISPIFSVRYEFYWLEL